MFGNGPKIHFQDLRVLMEICTIFFVMLFVKLDYKSMGVCFIIVTSFLFVFLNYLS